ncbi:hypothetical protein HPB51_006425 [Rhipicephalus microplus]|uniref:Uncharacterized protein n=1 Tax=Rhipicephalus microplus TaxID=6941 RepID=A0A9J6E799_RHIMP|nr:hypothetical protein HPB51_006425 [Rhipicephalus microplus]
MHSLQERLARLDLERNCSQSVSKDSCWLCDDLEKWNAVLNPMNLHLIEWKLGKLQLCTRDRIVTETCSKNVDLRYDADYFMAWLPRKHSCVEAICITEHHPCRRSFITYETSVKQRASKLRHIFVEGDTSYDWALLFDNLGPISSLETFKLHNVRVSDGFGAKVGEILSTSRATVDTVTLSKAEFTGAASEAIVSGLSKCKKLRKLSFSPNLNTSALRSMAKLLRSSKTLEKLQVQSERESNMYSSETRYRINELEMSLAVATLLKQSTSLVELHYQASKEPLVNVLMAVEASDLLRHLVIIGDDYKVNYIDQTMADLLESVLLKNRSLRSLTVKCFKMLHGVAAHVSRGLQRNTTLETLDVSQCCMDASEVQVLCNTLKQNTTLLKLMIEAHSGSKSDRLALYADLDKNGWYSRVYFPNIDVVTQGLVTSVSEPALCPADLHLMLDQDTAPAHDGPVDLARGEQVIPIRHAARELLGLQLRRNGGTGPRCERLRTRTHAGMPRAEQHVRRTHSLLLESNESLCTFHLSSLPQMEPEQLNAVSHGLVENKFITDVRMNPTTLSAMAAVQRNLTCLHRAVRFVLRRNIGKRFAESFELLESKAVVDFGIAVGG